MATRAPAASARTAAPSRAKSGKGRKAPTQYIFEWEGKDRKGKTIALKSQIKSAMIYPIAVLTVAFAVTVILMLFVIPAFKGVFSSFGANLPAPTLLVIAVSDFFVRYWYLVIGVPVAGITFY